MLPELKLKPKEERRIFSGHYWIFSNELDNPDNSLEAGTMCKVVTSAGKLVGAGFFNPHSLIAVRLVARNSPEPESDFIAKRIGLAYSYRQSLGIGPYSRVCFGEADKLPGLVVDRYGSWLVVEILSAGMERLKRDVIKSLQELFQPKGIVIKNSSSFRHLEGLPAGEPEILGQVPESVFVEELGAKYSIPILSGQKTGYYYDQRDNRAYLKPYFQDRSVLDVCCYVGGFSIQAALSGAKAVWGIDSSAAAVEYAQNNAALNKAENAVFHKADMEEVLGAFRSGQLPHKPDFVILDPPNLVKSRKNIANARKLYIKLNEMAIGGLPKGGYLATASCSHHVSREMFLEILAEAAARSGKTVFLVETLGQAKDHPVLLGMPETEYLHFALLQVR